MASGVVQPHVRLHLDQAGHAAVRAHQQLADQGASHVAGVPGEKLRGSRKCCQSTSGAPAGAASHSPASAAPPGPPGRAAGPGRLAAGPARPCRPATLVPAGGTGWDRGSVRRHAAVRGAARQLRHPETVGVCPQNSGEPLDLDATGPGPAPPGVVRRETGTPGSSRATASLPRAGWAATSSGRGTRRWNESRTTAPTSSCAWRKGIPFWTSHSARSAAADVGPSAALAMAWVSKVAVAIRPRHRRQRPLDLVDGVEKGLLVLLQVPVIGEREAFHRRQQPGQVAD